MFDGTSNSGFGGGLSSAVHSRTVNPMDTRWERLFADLEGQLGESFDEDEIPELVEAERVSVRLCDRLRGRVGKALEVVTTDGTRVRGTLLDAEAGWIVLRERRGDTLVPTHAVATCAPLGSAAVPHGGVERSFGAALRAVARGGGELTFVVGGVQIRGRLTGVGADHCDVRPEWGSAVTIPLTAIRLVWGCTWPDESRVLRP